MTIGIVGRKSGMTRVFTAEGDSVAVTVIDASPNRVLRVKQADVDGYDAVQVTAGERRASRVSKSAAGEFAKAGVAAGRGLWELRPEDAAGLAGLAAGAELTVAAFEAGQKVDVTARSRGKGYQGTVRRWNFRTQDATHGNSVSHRVPGSIGQNQSPGKVFKGKKMSGHMGDRQVTTQNLEIVRVDVERNLLLIKGAVPGAPGGDVIVCPAVKARA